MRFSAAIATTALCLGGGLAPASEAASYLSFKKKALGTPVKPTARSPATPSSLVANDKRPNRAGPVPLPMDRDNENCAPFKSCTSCTLHSGCAWCKNLNECVVELGTVQTCTVAGRRSEGLFPPEANDHVSAPGSGLETGGGTCSGILNPRNGLYHVHPDQTIVVSCDYIRERKAAYGSVNLGADDNSTDIPCCGDGVCGDAETVVNCPADCDNQQAPRHIRTFKLDNTHLGDDGSGSQGSRLFGDKVAVVVEHPTYHCHQSYEGRMEKNLIKWFLDRPSHDLKMELEAGTHIQLKPGAQVLELGCGDGRDSLYMGTLGHVVTGVDVGARAIEIAIEKASERGLSDVVEFLAYDALQLPTPLTPVDFIYDNTVYCNLRFEYLEKVLAMLERVTTPGRTVYMLNCGNANDRGLVLGHPRLRREAIEADLSGMFDILKVYEGVYDMDLSGTTAKHASKWNKENRGVLSWTLIMRRKAKPS